MLPFGVSYYPEITPENQWAKDLDTMKTNGITIVRVLEFAWSAFEPQEGRYDFSWVDRFIGLIEERGMQLVLGTPSATPPAWLTEQYPEMYIVMRDGQRLRYGERRAVCVNNTIYRHYCVEIAKEMAQRYGQKDCVVGWQIDNELIGPEFLDYFECHCNDCKWRFRQYLKAKYGDVKTINEKWYLRFWSCEFSDFGEVDTPRVRRHARGHVMEYFRFYNDSNVEFIKLQYAALREHISEKQFISTNSTGIFDRPLNHRDYCNAIDVAGWDAYNGAAANTHPSKHAFTALAHNLFRSAKHKPFWVFETNTNDMQNPAYLAEMRARGASHILFWHWRRHRGSMERTAQAFCDYNGRPHQGALAKHQYVQTKTKDLPELPATLPRAPVAIVLDMDNVRVEHRENKRPFRYLDALVRLYEPFWKLGIHCDVINPGDDTDGYKVIAMPDPLSVTKAYADWITTYAQQGRQVIATARLAHQDDNGVFHPVWGDMLKSVFGVTLYDEIPAGLKETRIEYEGHTYTGKGRCDHVDTCDAKILGTFTTEGFNNAPAVTQHACGKGQGTYIAEVCEDLALDVVKRIAHDAQITTVSPPEGLIAVPDSADPSLYWLCNHTDDDLEYAGHRVKARDFVARVSLTTRS